MVWLEVDKWRSGFLGCWRRICEDSHGDLNEDEMRVVRVLNERAWGLILCALLLVSIQGDDHVRELTGFLAANLDMMHNLVCDLGWAAKEPNVEHIYLSYYLGALILAAL